MTIQRIVYDWAKVPAISFATTFALLLLAIRGFKRVSRTAAILAPILLAVYANRTGWDTDVGMATVFCGLIPSALLMFAMGSWTYRNEPVALARALGSSALAGALLCGLAFTLLATIECIHRTHDACVDPTILCAGLIMSSWPGGAVVAGLWADVRRRARNPLPWEVSSRAPATPPR